MIPNRSTLVQLAHDHCPAAVDFEIAGRRGDRSIFQPGIAAHAVLQVVAEEQNRLERLLTDAEKEEVGHNVVRALVTEGRAFDGVPEPAMHPDQAMAGRDIALEYLSEHEVPLEGKPEAGIAADADWKIVPYGPTAHWRALLDVVEVRPYGDEESEGVMVIVTDYKSAWPTDESELDTIQMKGQALLAVALHPDVDFVQQQVINLRTGALYKRSIMLDEQGQQLLARWREDIKIAKLWAEVRDEKGNRRMLPGAGCIGCPFAAICPATRMQPDGEGPEARAVLYATLKARADALAPEVRLLTKEAPIRLLDGSVIGYVAKPRRRPTEAATKVLLAAIERLHGDDHADPSDLAWLDAHGAGLSMLRGLSLTTTNLENIAKVLFNKRPKAEREAFVASITETYMIREFDMRKEAVSDPT